MQTRNILSQPEQDVLQELHSSLAGLSQQEADARWTIYGPNVLENRNPVDRLRAFSIRWRLLSWVRAAHVSSVTS
jgi:cation transport ATPase-like protein